MHHELLDKATKEQLADFLKEELDELKTSDKEMYEELESKLYVHIYGKHFNEYLLKKATEEMENEDGTKGGHWTVEQTNSVLSSHAVDMAKEKFNEYDFNYVMNMIYSDYYGAVSNDVNTYYKMAIKFLTDKDSKEGKAYCYYKMFSK